MVIAGTICLIHNVEISIYIYIYILESAGAHARALDSLEVPPADLVAWRSVSRTYDVWPHV